MTATIDLNSNDDVSLASLLEGLVDEPTRVSSQTALVNDFAPTLGRVARVTSTDAVYIGTGDGWQSLDSFVSLLTSRSWRRLDVATANTTLSDQGVIQPVDTSGGAVTVTLASAATEDGAELIIKDEGGAAGTNAVTIATEGGETIDGNASITIASNYDPRRLYSDGSVWYLR